MAVGVAVGDARKARGRCNERGSGVAGREGADVSGRGVEPFGGKGQSQSQSESVAGRNEKGKEGRAAQLGPGRRGARCRQVEGQRNEARGPFFLLFFDQLRMAKAPFQVVLVRKFGRHEGSRGV